MSKAGKLHELLAVEGGAKGEKDRIKEETLVTFAKRAHLFTGYIKKLHMLAEERKTEEGEERQSLSETVHDKLDYMSDSFTRYWDIKLQKESANQEAKADVEIDGVAFCKDLPVSFLLSMEDELKQMRKVYDSIPTLQPGIAWEEDNLTKQGAYKTSHPTEKNKTEKTVEHKVIVPPTKEHPARVSEWTEDRTIGKYITTSWSGMITPTEKSLMIGRVDKMLRAFKKARQRANCQETKKRHIGKDIFKFINEPWIVLKSEWTENK